MNDGVMVMQNSGRCFDMAFYFSAGMPAADPYENIEPLQLVKYTEGQKYEPHFDYGEACDFEENLSYGPRHVTVC